MALQRTLSNRSMPMEHLVLGLTLLAEALAAGNPLNLKKVEKKVLDMAPTSFDDQYQGCSRTMEKELGELNRTEFTNNSVYAKYWTKAAAEWKKNGSHVPRTLKLRTEHVVALMAYTLPGRFSRIFNTAVRESGHSRREYMEKFQFKTLHFLLTQALKILREAQPLQCYQVYRGVRGIRFTARRQDLVRFGQFASTSLNEKKAKKFGKDTFFSVSTCYGVPIRQFSAIPNEEEVLIPPYERFMVTNINYYGNSTHIQLESTGTCSKYNCEWVKGKRCQDQPCDFSAGRTILGDLPAPPGAPPGRHGPGSRDATNATDATAPRRERKVQDGRHQHHRDGGMAGDSIWGWGHGDSPAAAPVPS